MRIVAGRFKGATLATPPDQRIRPTTDRVRESLFNVLEHGYGVQWPETRVLDLFAGTGALGCEAMSRGAAFALFVEISADARGLIRRNTDTLGLAGVTKIYRRDATGLGDPGTLAPFDLVFADPPYGQGLGDAALNDALEHGWLAPDALIVLEEAHRSEVALSNAFEEVEQRRYGDTLITFLRILAAKHAD